MSENKPDSGDCDAPAELVEWFEQNLTHDTFQQWSNVDFAESMLPFLAKAWDAGYEAAREVVDFEGKKVWAHAVMPDEYRGNPYVTATASPKGASDE